MLYATSTMPVYERPMVDITTSIRFRPAAAMAVAWVVLGAALGGCADLGDGPLSGAFVNPATYDYYDCKQLAEARKSLVKQTEKWQQLIDKANSGTAGPVVSTLVYRGDYISTRASAKQVEEAWQQNKCTEASAASSSTPAPPTPPNIRPGNARPPGRSGSAVS
jgi:hypothetical protein